MKKSVLIGVAVMSVLALSACGTSASAPAPNSSGPGTKTPTKITVGAIPIVDTAPLYLGVKEGFFKDQGLDVTIQTGGGGAAIVPGVVSGSFDFGFSNLVSLMVARDKGLDLKVVTNGVSVTGDTAKDYVAVVVRGDSAIKGVADLAGKNVKVAVNNLSNIGDTAIRSAVDQAGGDAASMKFQEIAFPDVAAAIENRQVDAAYTVEPFLTLALESGDRAFYVDSMMNPKQDISGYFATGDTIKNKPALVKAFKTAMNKSLEYAQAHPDKVRQIVTTYTKITAEVTAKITLPVWRVEINRDSAKQLGDAAVKFGTLKSAPDLKAMLP